jgi:hypothetical protein
VEGVAAEAVAVLMLLKLDSHVTPVGVVAEQREEVQCLCDTPVLGEGAPEACRAALALQHGQDL